MAAIIKKGVPLLREMELGDIPQVTEIENEAFPEPWPSTDFRRELTFNKLSRYVVAYHELDEEELPGIAEENGSPQRSKFQWLTDGLKRIFGGETEPVTKGQLILGYAGLWFLVDEAHLASIAVRRAYRQLGIGELLLIKCIDASVEQHDNFVTLYIRF